jgi:hypothetical protein
VQVVFKLLECEYEIGRWNFFYLWYDKKVEEDEDYRLQSAAGFAERDEAFFLFAEIDFPESGLFMLLSLDFRKIAVFRKNAVECCAKFFLDQFAW